MHYSQAELPLILHIQTWKWWVMFSASYTNIFQVLYGILHMLCFLRLFFHLYYMIICVNQCQYLVLGINIFFENRFLEDKVEIFDAGKPYKRI